MDAASLAALLNGSEYPLTIGKDIKRQAKEAGLVIVYGASDDLMELDGAISEEIGAYEGVCIKIDSEGVLPDFRRFLDDRADIEDFRALFRREGHARTIDALWEQDGYAWVFKTDIPHVTFEITDDGEPYCRGIVFALKDIA